MFGRTAKDKRTVWDFVEVEETYRLGFAGDATLSVWSSISGKIAVKQTGVDEPIYIDKELVPALCQILTQLQED